MAEKFLDLTVRSLQRSEILLGRSTTDNVDEFRPRIKLT